MNELDSNDKQLLRRAYSRIDSASEIMRFLSEYFRDKYGLTPDNQITPEGQIVSVSDLREKEILNGAYLEANPSQGPERFNPESTTVSGMSGDMAVLHDTTNDN